MPKATVPPIPCFNQAAALGETLGDQPRPVPGITKVLALAVYDGSTGGTAQVVQAGAADYIARHRQNRDWAQAFMTGLAPGTSTEIDGSPLIRGDQPTHA
jgi:hypothetical protein